MANRCGGIRMVGGKAGNLSEAPGHRKSDALSTKRIVEEAGQAIRLLRLFSNLRISYALQCNHRAQLVPLQSRYAKW